MTVDEFEKWAIANDPTWDVAMAGLVHHVLMPLERRVNFLEQALQGVVMLAPLDDIEDD